MNPQVECAAILAGGKSSRMGREKALLPFDNQPLIARAASVLRPIFPRLCVVTSRPEVARAAGCEAIADGFPGRGPLAGIHAALSYFQSPVFVFACDMPFLCAPFIEWMSRDFDAPARVPLGEGGFEPLHAVYSPGCLPIFENHLRGDAKMPPLRRVLEEVGAQFVPLETARSFDPTLSCFTNWNTPGDTQNLR